MASAPLPARSIPVNVFNGFLGAGKTTTLLALLRRLPPGYRCALLKNEFGDAKVDSLLARESSVAVSEMTNGCVCCVLIGVMGRAMEEIREKYNPDRIIIETSDSAFPAPIVLQIKELAGSGFYLDGVVTVIDCVNFKGYKDTSYTAKMQAQVSERELDDVIEHVSDLNPDTPRIMCEGQNGVHPDLIFGHDAVLQSVLDADRATSTSLLLLAHEKYSKASELPITNSNDSSRDGSNNSSEHRELESGKQDQHQHHHHDDHYENEVDLIQIDIRPTHPGYSQSHLEGFLKALPKDKVYRVKGLVHADGAWKILNYAFGRHDLRPVLNQETIEHAGREGCKVVVMGVELGLKWLLQSILNGFKQNSPEDLFHVQVTLRKQSRA